MNDSGFQKATVLFSGGQDSTTCLFWALQGRGTRGEGQERQVRAESAIRAIAFRYGQRHDVELRQAAKIAKEAGVELEVIDLTGMLTGSALIDAAVDVNASHEQNEELPASFVPGRNALFLTLAASRAYARGHRDPDGSTHLIGGMCETDYSGYPDCRLDFVESQAETLSRALDTPVHIHTPLMHLTKAETWKLAADLGTVAGCDVLETVRTMSHTDYHGDRSELHDWGYGRLDNQASTLRARGYEEAVEKGWIVPEHEKG